MRMLALLPFALSFALPVLAEPIACPNLATAVQVGACPSEEELQFTFSGYCSDNARMYNWQEEQVCTDYKRYRQLKNVVLWEAEGGKFQSYVSCDLAADKIGAARLSSITATRKGNLTRVACTYTGNVVFAYRTKGQCRVEGSGDCIGNSDACKATCD